MLSKQRLRRTRPLSGIGTSELLEGHRTTDRAGHESAGQDDGQEEAEVSHFAGVDERNHFEGHGRLQPGVHGSEPEAHHCSRHVDTEHICLLEVGHYGQSKRGNATSPQTDPVDGHDATAIMGQVIPVILFYLLVANVNRQYDQEGDDVQ